MKYLIEILVSHIYIYTVKGGNVIHFEVSNRNTSFTYIHIYSKRWQRHSNEVSKVEILEILVTHIYIYTVKGGNVILKYLIEILVSHIYIYTVKGGNVILVKYLR